MTRFREVEEVIACQPQRLLYVGDVVLYPLHLEHTDWLPIYDLVPDKAEISKRAIFDLAAETRCWVIGQHFPPFPGLGHVVKMSTGWEWRPELKS